MPELCFDFPAPDTVLLFRRFPALQIMETVPYPSGLLGKMSGLRSRNTVAVSLDRFFFFSGEMSRNKKGFWTDPRGIQWISDENPCRIRCFSGLLPGSGFIGNRQDLVRCLPVRNTASIFDMSSRTVPRGT